MGSAGVGVVDFLPPISDQANQIVPNWTTLGHSTETCRIVHTTQSATTHALCRPLNAIDTKTMACQISTPSIMLLPLQFPRLLLGDVLEYWLQFKISTHAQPKQPFA